MAHVSYKDIARSVANQLDKQKAADIAHGLAAYLVGERRANELGKIMREVERIRHQEHGILEIDITSAHEITADIEQQVSKLFDAKTIKVNKQIDKRLVGGVKIQAEDTLIDLSVRGQLNKMRAHNF